MLSDPNRYRYFVSNVLLCRRNTGLFLYCPRYKRCKLRVCARMSSRKGNFSIFPMCLHPHYKRLILRRLFQASLVIFRNYNLPNHNSYSFHWLYGYRSMSVSVCVCVCVCVWEGDWGALVLITQP